MRLVEEGLELKIVINGGHYPGRDCGALGRISQEAEITRELMSAVAGYLRVVNYDVLEVQENDLAEVVQKSNDFGADLFISIHCNGSVNRNARGTEVYYFSPKGAIIAQCIQNQIVHSLETLDRGIKESATFYVLKQTNCIAVLVETAFITNEEDEKILLVKRNEFARAIARGITDYHVMLATKTGTHSDLSDD